MPWSPKGKIMQKSHHTKYDKLPLSTHISQTFHQLGSYSKLYSVLYFIDPLLRECNLKPFIINKPRHLNGHPSAQR